MRSAHLRATLALVAAAVSGCDATLPWTEASTSDATNGSFSVSPASLTFEAPAGGPTPPPQRLDVTLRSGGVYLAVVPAGAAATANLVIDSSTSGHIDVSVRAPTTKGTYSGTVTVTGCADPQCTAEVDGSPVVVPVTYVVTGVTGPTALTSVPVSLTFQQAAGAADPAPQTITLSQQGGGSSAWYTCIGTWDTPLTWLTLTPGTGATLPATIQVAVHGAGLAAGTTRSATLYYQTVPCGQTASNATQVPLTFTVTP